LSFQALNCLEQIALIWPSQMFWSFMGASWYYGLDCSSK